MRSAALKKLSRLPKFSAHEIGRPHFRVQNPIVANMGEAIIQPSYDYYEVAVSTATTKQLLFTVPQGQQYTPAGGAAFTKTYYHTDMQQSGVLPAPNKLLVRAVAVWVRGNIHPTDLNLFLDNAMVTFSVNTKDYLVLQAGKMPAGGGGWFTGTITGAQTAGNGYPHAENLYTITDGDILGVQIEQQQNFQVIIDPTQTATGVGYTTLSTANGGFGVSAHVYLEGVLLRAVQ